MNTQSFYVHPTAVIDEGATIGAGSKIWHFCHVSRGAKIGERCALGQNTFVGVGVELGADCRVQNNVSIYEGVTCEDEVFLGPSMVFTNVINPRSTVSRKDEFKTTVVRRGATIGANATIVCGVEIGTYAFIGAGAVVTKDVAPFALVVGNPGKHIGYMSVRGRRLTFGADGLATCPEGGESYRLTNARVTRVEVG
jgi:UDP-2-acetamido-3-amino-2,3-dideoxy-glucuronate N-acetyltransferase